MLTGLNHITITVRDLEESLAFYQEVLGFTAHCKWAKGAYLSLNHLWYCLALGKPNPAEDYTHFAFSLAETDFARFRMHLAQFEYEQWQQNTSEGDSIYLLDPNGHKLEVHCGNMQSRLDSLTEEPYEGLEWF